MPAVLSVGRLSRFLGCARNDRGRTRRPRRHTRHTRHPTCHTRHPPRHTRPSFPPPTPPAAPPRHTRHPHPHSRIPFPSYPRKRVSIGGTLGQSAWPRKGCKECEGGPIQGRVSAGPWRHGERFARRVMPAVMPASVDSIPPVILSAAKNPSTRLIGRCMAQ